MSLNQEIDQRPFGVDYGRLDNGLSYYVRCNPKPKMRAALALAVNIGSVFFFFYSLLIWGVSASLIHAGVFVFFKKLCQSGALSCSILILLVTFGPS